MRKILPYIVLGLVLAACTKDERAFDPHGKMGDQPISFSTSTEKTKADATLETLQSEGWGLYGYYTGTNNYTNPSAAKGVIFNERKVSWDSTNSVWDYSIDSNHKKEYWPMASDEKVSFFAFGPYETYKDAATVDSENGPQVSYTATTDLTAQKDLLWATNTSGLPHRNVNLASYPDSVVDMHFRHAPAKIHFTINGATLGDTNGQPYIYGNSSSTTSYSSVTLSNEATGGTYNRYTLYYAYRTKTVVTTQRYRQDISGYKILMNSVEMTKFIKDGVLYLNNPDSYTPNWSAGTDEFLTYSFDIDDFNPSIANPSNESTLSAGWGTTYLGVDADAEELLTTPNNYIYMVPKTADTLTTNSNNITITARYHVIGLSKRIQFTRTTTTVSYQRVPYFTRNGNTYALVGNSYSRQYDEDDWEWDDINTADYPISSSYEDSASTDTGSTTFDYSQDNDGNGFKAVGSIGSDILGGRDYTINLYLDGRELRLTVIPQPWDLNETTYDYNTFINPVIQSLTYDSDFVYEVIGSNVYINNRMGKFYFKLGSGMYLYWQASLIGDDAFAFTDENGNYLLDDDGSYRTTVRGDIGQNMNYIYVKAINTSSQVTSKAKLRIYLFNSENRAVVALPKSNWLFVSATYINSLGESVPVQEWSVVQTAN